MTAKQRAKIYRQAAEDIFYGREEFCCISARHALESLFNINIWSHEVEEYFPELFQFNPFSGAYNWWGRNEFKENHDCRILTLLLSEQIALNP